MDLSGPSLADEEMNEINGAGRERGCHRCGAREPGTLSGNFVPEYHPPRVHGGGSVVIPTCLTCNRTAGTLVTMSLHRRL